MLRGYSRVLTGTRGYSTALAGGRQRRSTSLVPPGTFAKPLGHWRARPLPHGLRAARAVPSCAGAYVYGADGSNECPAGFVRIEAEAACRTAAAAAGKTIWESTFVVTRSDYPRGCYHGSITAWLNAHTVGAGRSTFQLLCAFATTGVSPRTLRGSVGPTGVWLVWCGTLHRLLTERRSRVLYGTMGGAPVRHVLHDIMT